jgi:heme/copper-type cytochrome/quinol oxidase subunit 2
MASYPFALSAIFLCLSVTLLAQASITIYNYNHDAKAKDLNFYWSCFVIVGAIIGVIASALAMFSNRGSAAAAAQNLKATVTGPPALPTAASLGAQLEAVQNLEQAQAEVQKALVGGAPK